MRNIWMGLLVFLVAAALAGCFGSSAPVKKEPAAKLVEAPYVPPAAPQGPMAALLSIVVEGATYPTLATFKQKLALIPGVKSIYQQSFNKDAASQLQVEYVGSAQVLADSVQNLSTQQLPVEVLGFDPSKIELRLGPGMPGPATKQPGT